MSVPSPLFQEFCIFLDKLSTVKASEKRATIQSYINKWVRGYGPDIYDAIRLLLPKGDTERKYNLKEDKIAAVLIKALAMNSSSKDGIRLRKYKQPVANNEKTAGNFPLIAYEEIKKRSIVESCTLTVRETNEYLDRLADRDKNEDQTAIFKEMLNSYTAQQMHWILRIILKDLRIHCGEKQILNAIYDGAYDAWTTNKSLRDICQLGMYTTTTGDGLALQRNRRQQLKLFNMLIPQTCDPFSEKLYNQLEKPFYVEKKLDGERVIMHFDRDTDQFLWHSRRRVEENYLYGATSRDMTKLSGHIHNGIKARKIILDGEMIAYHPMEGIFLEFGTLKTAAKKDINDKDLPHPCYVVFDILMVDDTPLIENRLEDRLKVLEAVVQEQGMHLKFVSRAEMESRDQINEELEKVLLNREEGLVIKDKSSTYQIDKRSPKWLKYKPSFMDSLVDTCDLLVVGLKYGSGRLGGQIGSILCAVRDDRIPDTEPPKFMTFTLAGNLKSQSVRELMHLMKTISDHNPRTKQEWLDHPIPGESFDKLIDYQDGIVVEVKGTEIVDSNKFGMQCTLRFPKYVDYRSDKGWQDIMTYSDVMNARAEGVVGKKRRTGDKVDKAGGKRSRRGTILLASQLGSDSSNVQRKTTIFQGKIFYVMNGTKLSDYEPNGILKNDLDLLIKENGGEYRQNKTADLVIAGVHTSRVDSSIQADKDRDILHPSYILDSIEAKKLLPITPKYMFYTSPKTQEDFLKTMDIYGDYFSKKVKAKELIEIMDRMQVDTDLGERRLTNMALEVAERYFPEGMNDMLFLNCVAYFDTNTSMPTEQPIPITSEWVDWKRIQEQTELAKAIYQFQAGRVSSSVDDSSITHVVFNKHDLSRLSELSRQFSRQPLPRFVTLEWINQCYEQEVFLNETEFDPKYCS